MIGPGEYDKECEAIQRATDADSVIVMVFGGDRGVGFSMSTKTTKMELVEAIPGILRKLADSIEADAKKLRLQ